MLSEKGGQEEACLKFSQVEVNITAMFINAF